MTGALVEDLAELASEAHLRSRLVSLVPSWTEALFALGLGPRVVGVTDWCVHPAAGVADLPKVGGTKNPEIATIAALRPDLVIANREENTRRSVDALLAHGIDVWLTYPRTVADGLAAFEAMQWLAPPGDARAAAAAIVRPSRTAFEQASTGPALTPRERRPRVFCPIWRDPWMAVARSTYIHDLIELCGGANVFAERGDRRYPIVTLADVEAAAPQVILLPDEPYAFQPGDVAELTALALPAARSGRIHCVDGTLLSWYGPRIATALPEVARLLAAPAAEPAA